MPDNSYGKTFNGLYIDTIFIDNNDSATMTSSDGYNTTDGNYLVGLSDINSNLTKNYGSRWLAQLTNGSGSTIDFNDTNLIFNICTNYKQSESDESEDNDSFYYLSNGTLSAGESVYFGWGNTTVAGGVLGLVSGETITSFTMASNPPTDGENLNGKLIPGLKVDLSTNENYLLIADQIYNNNILCTTKFKIKYNGSFTDFVGESGTTPTNEADPSGPIINFDNSLKRFIFYTTGNNNSGSSRIESTGYFTRSAEVTSTVAPTLTYAESDWIIRCSGKTAFYYLVTHASVEDGTAKTYNGLYIDTVYIDNQDSATMTPSDGYNTTNGNYLKGLSDIDSNLSKNYGSRWVVQVTNGSGSTIDFNDNNLIFNICTNYKQTGSDESEDKDTFYYLYNGTLSNNKSIYFGWGNSTVAGGVIGIAKLAPTITLASNPPSDGENLDGKLIPGLKIDLSTKEDYLLIADQIYNNNILCTTKFKIKYNGSYTDFFGESGTTPVEVADPSGPIVNFDNSLKRFVLYTTGNNNSGNNRNKGGHGIITRKSSVTSTNAPTLTYTESDWDFKCISSNDYLSSKAVGDPHIQTLFGENYKFDYLGAFRLFDNNEDLNNRIIINGYSELGRGEKWKDNQYITKIFIFHKGNYCLINTGYRGEKAKIEINFGINITETELQFNDEARVYCHDCTRNINHNDFKKIYKHKIKNKHTIPYTLRNMLTIRLKLENYEDLIIQVSNVNEYNLQPCRIEILNHPYLYQNKNNLSGCIINRKYSTTSKLNDIKYICKIKEPTKKELYNLPKLERKPELINIKFN